MLIWILKSFYYLIYLNFITTIIYLAFRSNRHHVLVCCIGMYYLKRNKLLNCLLAAGRTHVRGRIDNFLSGRLLQNNLRYLHETSYTTRPAWSEVQCTCAITLASIFFYLSPFFVLTLFFVRVSAPKILKVMTSNFTHIYHKCTVCDKNLFCLWVWTLNSHRLSSQRHSDLRIVRL